MYVTGYEFLQQKETQFQLWKINIVQRKTHALYMATHN